MNLTNYSAKFWSRLLFVYTFKKGGKGRPIDVFCSLPRDNCVIGPRKDTTGKIPKQDPLALGKIFCVVLCFIWRGLNQGRDGIFSLLICISPKSQEKRTGGYA